MSGETQYAAGQRAQAGVFNEHLAQPWQLITPMNGWTNAAGTTAFQARFSNQVTVEIIGVIQAGTIAAGVQVGQLPASMCPANAQAISWVIFATSAVSPTSAMLEITAAGAIKAYNLGASTPSIAFHGFISIDA